MRPASPIIEFKRGAVSPVECIKQGWHLIRDQYWLFVGMSFVGLMIANFVPFGILLGPMMCGIYLSLFRKQRGEQSEFGDLFKGFDYFGESVIATLFHIIPMIFLMVVFYAFFFVGFFIFIPASGDSESTAVIIIFALFAIGIIMMLLAVILLSILFTFTYTLIVDRKLSGIDAVKWSCRAALANFGRIFGLMLLNGLLAFGGLLLCYVGVFLVIPISFAGMMIAYQQVFGLGTGELGRPQSPLPPPPPQFT